MENKIYSLDYLRSLSLNIKDFPKIVLLPEDNKYCLGVGLTTKCNLNCPFCYYHQRRIQGNFLFDFKLFKKILDNLPFLKKISFSLEGENLLHPDFFKFIDYSSNKTRCIEITTNGMLLSEHFVNILRNYNISSIIVSIDSGDKDSYSFFRKGGNFSKLCRNIELVCNIFGNEVVKLYSVVSHNNLSSLVKLPQLASELKIKQIGLGQVRENKWSSQNNIRRAASNELVSFVESFCYECKLNGVDFILEDYFSSAKVMKEINKRIDNSNKKTITGNNSIFCNIPWFFTSILSNGENFVCCGDIAPIPIESYDFNGLFNNEALLLLRGLITLNKIPKVCHNCHNSI